MPKGARKVLILVFLVQVAWSGAVAIFMVFQWRGSVDEPDVSYPCDDGGTCYSGPTTFKILTFVFGGISLAFLVVVVLLLLRWRARAARRARLVATGARVPALLAAVEATGTTVNDRNVARLIFEARPGGRVVRAVERSMVTLPLGTRVTIAYDPSDPAQAVVVDDLDALGAAADRQSEHQRQSYVDVMFAQQPGAAPDRSGLTAVRDAVAENLEKALAELRADLDGGRITQAAHDQQRELLLRMLEMPTNRPLN